MQSKLLHCKLCTMGGDDMYSVPVRLLIEDVMCTVGQPVVSTTENTDVNIVVKFHRF